MRFLFAFLLSLLMPLQTSLAMVELAEPSGMHHEMHDNWHDFSADKVDGLGEKASHQESCDSEQHHCHGHCLSLISNTGICPPGFTARQAPPTLTTFQLPDWPASIDKPDWA